MTEHINITANIYILL